MQRRAYLRTGAAVVAGLAGCGGPGPGPVTPTPTATATPSRTPRDRPTGTRSVTPTDADLGAPPETTLGTPTGPLGAVQPLVMVAGDDGAYFDPVGLAVAPGDTVEWVVASGDHSTTAYPDRVPAGAGAWDSGILEADGETFRHTFATAGTYDYGCRLHRSQGMVGRIVVGEPGGPAEGSMPPDGRVPTSRRILDAGAVSNAAFAGE